MRSARLNPANLPKWLTAFQAVTWLATGDAALTRASADGRPTVGIPRLSYEEEASLAKEGEPLRSARAALAGEPGEWAGGWLEWLRVRTGKALRGEIALLVDRARSGKIETCDARGNPFPSGVWTLSYLDIETLETIQADDKRSRVLFARDGVFSLRAPRVKTKPITSESASPTSIFRNGSSTKKLKDEFDAYAKEQQTAGLRVTATKAVQAMKERVSPGVTRKAVRELVKGLPQEERRGRGRVALIQIAEK